MFGCSEGGRDHRFDDELADHLVTRRVEDRLAHFDGFDRDRIEERLENRRLTRRALLKGAGALTAAAAGISAGCETGQKPAAPASARPGVSGKQVKIDSVPNETVRIGQFRMDVPDIATVDSGDVLVYPNTLTHFLGALQPGVSVEELARMRIANPGKGPHSIIGPVAVRGAMPGDLLEVRFLRLDPIDFGANFHNPVLPGVRTGALPDEFVKGQVVYFKLDRQRMRTDFRSGIHIPLAPFQGTFGVAPPGREDAVSSVPPGQHGGNVDLREQTEGTTLWLPVWRPGARLYTGDTHVAQGDGEVNLTAIESALRELRVQVVLHQGVLSAAPEAERWPMAETATHWIAIGTAAPEPNQANGFREAFLRALHNVINFLNARAGLTRDDAYAFASMACSFRITQVVDVNIGVHAMIPKELFDKNLRQRMRPSV